MSLSVEAIKELRLPDLVSKVTDQLNCEPELISSVVAVPDNVNLINLEKYNQYKDRYEFNFQTESVPDFGEYCKEFTQLGSKCFIDPKSMQAQTIFDLGTKEEPLHIRHVAKLTLLKTAAYQAVLQLNGESCTQRTATDFIEDWTDLIHCYDSQGQKMGNSVAVQRLRKIDIDYIKNRGNETSNFSESQSTFEKIEAKNQDSLPAEIHFICSPYAALQERVFALKLNILTSGETPRLSFRIVKLEAHKEEIVNEFKDLIIKLFKDTELKTFIGR